MRPPVLARILAALVVDGEDRAPALADLEEGFAKVAAGKGRRAARRWYWSQALRGLGYRLRPDVARRHRRGWSGLWGDLRQRARALFRRPAYSMGVVGTLTVGLSSAALVGALAWGVWLSPMPFPDPDRVVRLFELEPSEAEASPDAEPTRWRLSPPLLEDLRAHDWETVSAVAGVARNVSDWERDGELTRITALTVSPEFFGITGVRPLAGELLRDDPDAREVVLTEGLWTRVFGRDPTIFGRETMRLDGEPYRVVGVATLPSGYPGSADLLRLLTWSDEQLVPGMRGARYLDVVARVRPGFDVAAASEELSRIVEAAGREYANHEGWGGTAVALGDDLLRPYRGILAMLLAAGVAFLLLAVVNVVGLVTARTVDSRSDRGVRLALGASEGRLLRESVVESGLLGASAAVFSLGLIRWLLPAVRSLVPPEVPRVEEVGLDVAGWLGIGGVALFAGGLVGVVAHLVAARVPVDARRGRGGSERMPGGSALVAGQVALTTLLVTTGVGVLGTVFRLQRVDLGFEPAGVASAQVMLTGERYPTVEERHTFWRAFLEEAEERGLTAAVGTSPPMAGVNMPWGYRADPTGDQAFAQYHIVSPGYFSVMGIEVEAGRTFEDGDRAGSEPVVVVNDVLAREAYPDGPAVGRRIEVVGEEKTIVGVVEDVRHFGPGEPVPAEIYAPFTQDPWPHAQILVRGAPEAVGGVVADVADAIDPYLGLPPVEPYLRFVADWFAGLHLQLVVVGLLASVGVLLATLGLYALIAYRVSTGRKEIGVRLALGASAASVFSRVVIQGMTVAGVGLVAGLVLWYATAPLVSWWSGEEPPGGPWLPAVVVLLVGLTSALATGIPARRTVGIDPARTLREE